MRFPWWASGTYHFVWVLCVGLQVMSCRLLCSGWCHWHWVQVPVSADAPVQACARQPTLCCPPQHIFRMVTPVLCRALCWRCMPRVCSHALHCRVTDTLARVQWPCRGQTNNDWLPARLTVLARPNPHRGCPAAPARNRPHNAPNDICTADPPWAMPLPSAPSLTPVHGPARA